VTASPPRRQARGEPPTAQGSGPGPHVVPGDPVVPAGPVTAGPLTVAGPAGPIDCLVTGSGRPVTVFVHGLTGSIAQTRPFGSGVTGSRVFVHLRGHGGTRVPPAPDGTPAPGGYREAAADVAAVVAATGAGAAVGISFGAGALLALLGTGATPLRRLVLCLPPSASADLDGGAPSGDARRANPGPGDAVRAGFATMADALDAGDVEALARALRGHQPDAVRRSPAVQLWARRHAADLVAGRENGLAVVLRAWPGLPVPAIGPGVPGSLPAILVLAQRDDPVHPLPAAEHWARLLGAGLEVLAAGGLPWSERDRARDLIAGHLNG